MKNNINFSPKSSLIKLVTLLVLAGATNDSIAQVFAQNQKDEIENTNNISISPANNLGIIQQQIKQFPKEVQENYKNNILGALEKEYKETGIDKLEIINNLLGKHIFANIKDTREQIIRAIISLEEGPAKFITKSEFSNRLENNNIEYNIDNSKFSDEFLTAYNNRYKTVYKLLLENKIAQNKDKIAQNKDKIAQNKDKINKLHINIKNSEQTIESEKKEFIDLLKRVDQELLSGTITNSEFQLIKSAIQTNSTIANINLQKDFPNVRKKIQETSK